MGTIELPTREIKFRGNFMGKRVYGYYYVNTLGMHNIVTNEGVTYEVLPTSVGQYTGLKDKNGLEIYEGDIVGTKNQNNRIVEWDKYNCCFTLVEYGCHWIEVIGNILNIPNSSKPLPTT